MVEYVLDQHSASQCTPLYDTNQQSRYQPWGDDICPDLRLPLLRWSGDVADTVTRLAADVTGVPVGTPVITGTIDAWAEAISVDAHRTGDLMLMYGTTMFLINTVSEKITDPSLCGTVGALPDTRNLAGEMATFRCDHELAPRPVRVAKLRRSAAARRRVGAWSERLVDACPTSPVSGRPLWTRSPGA